MSIKAHPRTRGENRVVSMLLKVELGSPPHTRGKQGLQYDSDYSYRLTPAHAGKTGLS